MSTDTRAISAFVDLLLDVICVVGKDGRFVFVSGACQSVFGYTADEMIGTSMIDYVHPEDRARTLGQVDKIVDGHPERHFENRYLRKDGQVVHIMWSARHSPDDQLRVAVGRDVTERKHAESLQTALYAISEAAHVAEDLDTLFRLIHRIIGELLPAVDFSVVMNDQTSGQLTFPYHAATCKQTALSQQSATAALCAEVVRTGQPLLLTPGTLNALPPHLAAMVDTLSLCWLGVPLTTNKGIIGALLLKSDAQDEHYTEQHKELLQFVSTQVATAIERKQLHARLQHMAQYDELTGLPNRGLLRDRLEAALARARREQSCMAVLYLDLDKFKQVNDDFGHAIGDRLLQEIARRLRGCVRDSDTVARMSGDEFVVLLENIQIADDAATVAKKISIALHQPLYIDGQPLQVLASIGTALYPKHGVDAQQLLKRADAEMYLVKKNAINGLTSEIAATGAVCARRLH